MHHDDAEPLSPAPDQTPHHTDPVPDVEAGSWVKNAIRRCVLRGDINVALPGGVPSGLLGIASFPPLVYRRGPDFIFKETQ